MDYPLQVLELIDQAKRKSATELSLRSQELTTIPKQVFELEHLEKLDLSDNRLKTVPEAIRRLGNLKVLDLSGNLLNVVPEAITRLDKLSVLWLGKNKLMMVPESITRLNNLRYLILSYNKLMMMPEAITRMSNLTVLWLDGNRLKMVPETITNLSNLTTLNLDDNPIESPPPELALKGIDAIRDYFRQIQEEGQDYLYEAKLLIVGEGGAGKTTLTKKIVEPSYVLQEEKTTEGIEVTRWEFPMQDGKPFRVNIWDFGGQEIYHATHQFFLTHRSLYLLVADTRKEDTDFYYWLNTVELLSDNSPLLIIKNEKQDRQREINERQLRGQFTNLKGTLATNLANNRGLSDVVRQIKHYITTLPHVGTPLPRTWVKVRERLEQDPRNHIPVQEFLDLCQTNGFTEHKDKLQLSGYLHDIGVILHFQDDPILKHVVILKPKWGTDAVYAALDNKQIQNNFGRFTKNDLAKIWSAPEYATMHDELLQLMMNFKLCYKIPFTDFYIAPQLLSESQPEYEWDSQDNLTLRYMYEFMPKGILTQLIVVMHRWIEKQALVWKSGMVLEHENTRAEVIEYYNKREVHVRVSGAHKRDLLTNVMYELDKIHESYSRLVVNKLIPCNCKECKTLSEPHYYRHQVLLRAMAARQETIQCQISFEMVKVRQLIDDVIDVRKLERETQFPHQTGGINIYGEHITIGGDVIGRDKSESPQ